MTHEKTIAESILFHKWHNHIFHGYIFTVTSIFKVTKYYELGIRFSWVLILYTYTIPTCLWLNISAYYVFVLLKLIPKVTLKHSTMII